MRRPRRPPLPVLILLALLTVLLPAGTVEAAVRAEVTALRLTVRAGGRTCVVDADLYRPAGASATAPVPAVLTTNGFGGSKRDGTTDALARSVSAQGYAVLAYSGLGFGRSGCPVTLDDPAVDGRAASALVDFLAGLRTADDGTRVGFVTLDGPGDPRVGMIGGSYGGAVQFATASRDHRVDALVPLITWHDLAHSLFPDLAGAGAGVHKWRWTSGFYAIGEAQGLLHPRLDPSRTGGGGCVHMAAGACALKGLLDSGRYLPGPTAEALRYAREVSPASYLGTVRAPTLLVQGQEDSLFTLDEAEATWRRLRAQGVPSALIWQSWGHSGGLRSPLPGELDLTGTDLGASWTGRRVLDWFDHYLRRGRGPRSAAPGPAFAYFRDWAPGYATAPAPPAPSRVLYVSGAPDGTGNGSLVADADAVRPDTRTYRGGPLPTSHTENPFAQLSEHVPDPPPYDLPGGHLGWSTAPLTAPLDVVGSPGATFRVEAPRAARAQKAADLARRLVLFVKVLDVAPDGTARPVRRLVAPVRVPDVDRPFTVRLPGIVHRFAPGHRLRLVVAGSDDAHYGNRTTYTVRVREGVLRLPTTSGR
ncbi:CocE/NonD family hydrolase [Streptomyces sp. NPDC007088]|uniref:CocE/NonD family hydrolase n=1 Tax=Streptomyces sp. NPDC007088 TaxID=3364773 RepID=UPI0036A42AEA